jgi:valyl-tRNA synthetase
MRDASRGRIERFLRPRRRGPNLHEWNTTMPLGAYDTAEIQDRWNRHWRERGYFHSEPNPQKRPYSIVIPPPNVTGALHLGHALTCTIQDVMIRFKRMQGFEALWMPGADHAGIATQAVVEKRLFEEEKKTRRDVGREALVQRIWRWKDEYEERIKQQLLAMGASCDWERWRFTLDDVCAAAVRHTFFRMFRDGLIYRGKRLVNWDVQLQTAVADDEVYHDEIRGQLWRIAYPVEGSDERLEIATTRPETMLGDAAVAVHPDDERFQRLIGRQVRLPLVDRLIPIIADGLLVDREFGTGAVKVTPAHDPNDYACGLRHKLPQINILHPDGRINDNGGPYAGLKIDEARKRVVADLEERGFLVKVEPHVHNVGHSDRSKTPIEPYLSDQWFVRMDELAERAIAAVREERVRMHPPRYADMYVSWLSEKRDWCISRQLWWGHQIPIWYCEGCTESDLESALGGREDVCWRYDEEGRRWLLCALEDLPEDAVPGRALRRDEDVLDTWFSSALWPHSTMGWPKRTPELEYYYPTNLLDTAREIISLWVARMVVMSEYNLGEVPFTDVFIHPVIQDGRGMPMKKSLGNGVDPLDIIAKYGADAMRYTLVAMTTETQDVRMPVKRERLPDGREVNTSEKFEVGRNFGTKIYNAAKFVLANLEGYEPGPLAGSALAPEEQWIVVRLARTAEAVGEALDAYRFAEVGRRLYDFVWGELCDWYIELVKPRLRPDHPDRRKAQRVAATVLDASMRLLHPVMPFLTEEVWHALNEAAPLRGLSGKREPAESVAVAEWDPADVRRLAGEVPDHNDLLERMNLLQDVVRSVRNIRAEFGVDAKAEVDAVVDCSDRCAAFLSENMEAVRRLARVRALTVGQDAPRPSKSAAHVLPDCRVYVPLAELIQFDAEIQRQSKRLGDLEKRLQSVEAKLANEKFTSSAPPEVVDQQRSLRRELTQQIDAVREILQSLRE